jgi:antitoxin component of RelBE/YafQ-DinJ toxin-antitoxin module
MQSTQINFRIPSELKKDASRKAAKIGYNLNGIVKLFLYKFVEDDNLVEIRKEIQMEKLFDLGVKKAFSSKASIKKTKRIAELLN